MGFISHSTSDLGLLFKVALYSRTQMPNKLHNLTDITHVLTHYCRALLSSYSLSTPRGLLSDGQGFLTVQVSAEKHNDIVRDRERQKILKILILMSLF